MDQINNEKLDQPKRNKINGTNLSWKLASQAGDLNGISTYFVPFLLHQTVYFIINYLIFTQIEL